MLEFGGRGRHFMVSLHVESSQRGDLNKCCHCSTGLCNGMKVRNTCYSALCGGMEMLSELIAHDVIQ
jgi:hypothetical protein